MKAVNDRLHSCLHVQEKDKVKPQLLTNVLAYFTDADWDAM